VAIAVAQQAMEEGVATEVTDNPVEKVFSAMWQPNDQGVARASYKACA
jgi:malate dehydrogenase (oxaloacetate-decarboxylating)